MTNTTILHEYLLLSRGNEQLLLDLSAPQDDFLDLLNNLSGRGFKYQTITQQLYQSLKQSIPAYTAK